MRSLLFFLLSLSLGSEPTRRSAPSGGVRRRRTAPGSKTAGETATTQRPVQWHPPAVGKKTLVTKELI